MTHRPGRDALTLAVLAALASIAPAGATEPSAAEPAVTDAQQLDRVEVIGSRIKRVDIETSQPTFVLERADLDRTGLITVGDILQQIVVNGAGLSTKINNGNDGSSQVDLRHLGSNRTLVLVNGRRWVAGLDGSVDLNTIPLAMIERIEVLKDGASAIYGSDAVAGVVNITTRKHYVGAEASAYYGEFAQGDGATQDYQFTLGAEGTHSSVALGVSYSQQEPVFAGDRAISAVPRFGFDPGNANAGASPTIPNGRFGFGPSGRRLPDGTPGTLTFDPSSGGYRVFDPFHDGYNFAPANYWLTPQERTSLFVQGRYEFTPTLSFQTELLYNDRRSDQLLAPKPLTFSPQAPNPNDQVVVPAENIFNPFGLRVTQLRFRPLGAPRAFSEDVNTFHLSGGFEGRLDLWDRSWTWDANATRSSNKQNNIGEGLINGFLLGTGLGPNFRDAAGVAHCGTPDAPIDGCVPLDFFHGQAGVTPEMLAYIRFTAHEQIETTLTDYAFNATGDVVSLPAGPLGAAFGYEHRRVSGFFRPDSLIVAGADNGEGIFNPSNGGYSVDEGYLEFLVPLLAEKPFAEVFELSLAARYSHYSNFGSTTNAKFGFRWKPWADLLVRGNWSEAFRAPSVNELFSTAAPGIDGVDDPCSAEHSPTGSVAQRCSAAGVPVGSYQQDEFQLVPNRFGANPELQPETATTRTLGMVWSPHQLPGFDLTLDWYKIQLENTIAAVVGQQIFDSCYDEGNAIACGLITRQAGTGAVLDVDERLQNVGSVDQEGYDLAASYRFDTRYGRFQVRLDGAYVSQYTGELPAGAVPASVVGTVSNINGEPYWRTRANLDLQWQRGDFSASTTLRYFGPIDENCAGPVFAGDPSKCDNPDFADPQFDGFPKHRIAGIVYTDFQFSWDAPWQAKVTLGLNNAFDRTPPVSYTAFANSSLPEYDIPGRFWYLKYTQKF